MIRCADLDLRQLLVANFGAMATNNVDSPPDLEFSVEKNGSSPLFSVFRGGRAIFNAENFSDLLFLLDKEIVVELQRRRADLFFLHSAAIAWQGNAFLLAAESGAGKSTTTWGMLHNGFEYLSDELSPLDIWSMQVFPYPHAICFKRQPPGPYPLPQGALHLGRTIHVPTEFLPSKTVSQPLTLGAVFLLDYRPDTAVPEVRVIGPGEAGARLYVNALNALAHTRHGLDAVAQISKFVPCFVISSAGLLETCRLIRTTLQQVAGHI